MKFGLEPRNFLFKTIIGLIAVNVLFAVSYYLSFNDAFSDRTANLGASYKQLLLIVNLLFLLVEVVVSAKSKREFKKFFLFLIGYFAVIVFLQAYEYSRMFHTYFLSLLFVFAFFLEFSNFTDIIEARLWKNAQEHKVIIIGDEFNSSLVEYVNTRSGNYNCVAFLTDNNFKSGFSKRIYEGDIDEIEEILSTQSIDEVLVSSSSLSIEKIENVMKLTEKYHSVTSILPPYFQYLTKQNYHTDYWLDVPIISVYHSKLSILSNQIVKRTLDIVFSLIVLAFVCPILILIVAPAIWLSSRGPIFFKQMRKGYKQKPFLCYKFRTMKPMSRDQEIVQATKSDPRLIPLGGALRKTSIDEIPQFINVLRGQMSVVGPRPHMVEHDELYDKFISRYNVRFVTKPGITGWAQVNGFRGGTEDSKMMEQRIECDLWYIKNWSIWLDIKIIALTFFKLFKIDRNAY